MEITSSTISIYGRDEIKQIIQMALNSEQPVHVLLTGEPGCGKTQFLENIKEYYKHRAYFTIGAPLHKDRHEKTCSDRSVL
jgi:MoxR-like ATPase